MAMYVLLVHLILIALSSMTRVVLSSAVPVRNRSNMATVPTPALQLISLASNVKHVQLIALALILSLIVWMGLIQPLVKSNNLHVQLALYSPVLINSVSPMPCNISVS